MRRKTASTGSSTVPKCGLQIPTKPRSSSFSLTYVRQSLFFISYLIPVEVDPSKGYKGITCFIVTKDIGFEIAKKEQKLGIRASSTCTLNFDNLRVPEENVIGGEGKGYKVSISNARSHQQFEVR